MKLKNEQEIKVLAKLSAGEPLPDSDLIAQWKCYIGGYEKGYTQAQQDLLSQASEGFDNIFPAPTTGEIMIAVMEDQSSPTDIYLGRKEAWQACSLSHAKKMQEKDAEIEALTKEKDAWKTMYLELRNRVVGG